jgi:molybdate transport system substrate-binding protein
MKNRWLPGLIGLLAGAMAACGGDDGRETVAVYAASSLTDAFTEMAPAFEEANPEYEAALNFASSSELAVQINEGAPADVFASANRAQMDVVDEAGNASEVASLSTNELALGVPADSETVAEFDDIAEPGTILIVAAPDVPVGALTRAALDALVGSGVRDAAFRDRALHNVASEEPNVRAVLAKLELGEADAGFVYGSDVGVAGQAVRQIEIPEEGRLSSDYFIALVGDAGPGAQAFFAFALSEEGQAILKRHGFGATSQ